MFKTWALELGGDPFAHRCYDPFTLMTIATVAGTAVSAVGTIAAGKAQAQQAKDEGLVRKQSADYQAAQLEMKGKEEQAAAQQEAEQYKRNKTLALSSLQSKAAGSGFSATDPTALALADEISRYGTLQEQMAMYGGTSRRAGLEDQAAGERFSGQSAYVAGRNTAKAIKKASYFDAASTILGGASTLAGKYAKPAAPAASSSYRYG